MKYKELIDQMTLDEKVSLLSGKDFWQTKSIERLGIPSICLADGPHGLRKQAANADHLGLNAGIPATCFPTAATIANSWDTALGFEIGSALGKEAVEEGVNILLGPALNIKRSPLCGRNFEYFSEDPYLSGKMAASYIKGIQGEGVSACPKHFAANNQERFRLLNDSVVDKRSFNEIYLTGFEIAVKEGNPKAIMSAYNKINGVYANENPELLLDILVGKWGFDGIVVSDWGGSNDHVEGVRNGSHLEMPSPGGQTDRELKSAILQGTIPEALVDKRVDKFLQVIFSVDISSKKSNLDFGKQHELALKAAEASIVLLKNDEKILPLQEGVKISVIGKFVAKPRYQGAGSSLVNPYKLVSTLDVLGDYPLALTGYCSGEDIEEACKIAEKSEVVLLFMGLDEASETEGLDRLNMSLRQNQIELLDNLMRVNPNIIAVLSGGSSIEMPWVNNCKAVVHGYLSGEAGASAMLNIITGRAIPCGKLAESYPYVLSETSSYHYYPGREATSEYREGLFVGYRYYDSADIEVLYPFGFGLSYTTFEYSNIKCTPDSVTFLIKNTGEFHGYEIPQLYISKESKLIFRPKKELKGFSKVFIKAGETEEVTILFNEYTFRYFDINTNKFEIEGGLYTIYVGSSSRDIKLTCTMDKNGTIDPVGYNTDKFRKYFSGKVNHITDSEFENLLGHKIPQTLWDRSKPLGRNDAIAQMKYAKSRFARLIHKLLKYMKDKSLVKGEPNLNILFIYYIPFRGIEKMMGEIISAEMVDSLLLIVNGHFFKGLGRFIRGFFKHKRLNKETADRLQNPEKYLGEKK